MEIIEYENKILKIDDELNRIRNRFEAISKICGMVGDMKHENTANYCVSVINMYQETLRQMGENYETNTKVHR